jgi:hypothetical protein
VRYFTGFVLVGMLVGLSMSGLNAFGQEAKDKPVYAELTLVSDDPVHFFDGNLTSAARIPGEGRTAENGAQALTVGVNWYLNSRTRVMLNWTHNWYDHTLGTPFSCPKQMPTCSASNLRPGDDTSWEFLSRLQIYF